MFLNMIPTVSYRVVYASEPISILSESFVATMICWWSSMTNEMLGYLVVCFDSFWDKLRVFKFGKMLPCNRMKTQWNASFLKKRMFTSHLENKSRTTMFSDPNQLLWKHFRSRARQRSNSQDQVSPYFRVFVLHTIYRLPNAIKVISDVPVNRIARSCEASHTMSRKIKIRWKIFNRTRENCRREVCSALYHCKKHMLEWLCVPHWPWFAIILFGNIANALNNVGKSFFMIWQSCAHS